MVDVKSRRRHTVLDKYIDCIALTAEVWDSSNIVVFLNVIRDIVDKKNNGGQLYVLSECCHGNLGN